MGGVLAALLAFGALRMVPFLAARARLPLPVLVTLPSYSFTNQDGARFGSAELARHPYVADFVFTRCPEICPRMTEHMAGIEAELRALPALRFVSISVDPSFDTPDTLKHYAADHHADLRRWAFLTGDTQQIEDTVVHGFKIALTHEPAKADFMGIVHGAHFVLVDGSGQIRGYYDSNDPARLRQLIGDARSLSKE
jgi:protein SCO1/2